MSAEELLVRGNDDHESEVGRETARIAPLYFAAVECVATQPVRITEALERLDLAGNTIVVFTADHGMQLAAMTSSTR